MYGDTPHSIAVREVPEQPNSDREVYKAPVTAISVAFSVHLHHTSL